MSPTKDLDYPSPVDLPDEPAEPDVDEDSQPVSEGVLGAPDDPSETDADHDSDAEDPIEDRVNLPRAVNGPDFDDAGDSSEDGGDPLVQKGPLVEDVPESERFPTL
jgi:hypothetical protein